MQGILTKKEGIRPSTVLILFLELQYMLPLQLLPPYPTQKGTVWGVGSDIYGGLYLSLFPIGNVSSRKCITSKRWLRRSCELWCAEGPASETNHITAFSSLSSLVKALYQAGNYRNYPHHPITMRIKKSKVAYTQVSMRTVKGAQLTIATPLMKDAHPKISHTNSENDKRKYIRGIWENPRYMPGDSDNTSENIIIQNNEGTIRKYLLVSYKTKA